MPGQIVRLDCTVLSYIDSTRCAVSNKTHRKFKTRKALDRNLRLKIAKKEKRNADLKFVCSG